MAIKNILLKTLYPIKQIKYFFSEHTQNTWEEYTRMQELSTESFLRNLEGDWELISIMEPPQPSLQDAFRYTATLTRKIYESHAPCRILYTDPDTLCIRPLDIWGRFKEFRLFDQMDQRVHPLAARWDGYWNCSVRYFPEGLVPKFWEGMAHRMQAWEWERYDYEQEMYRQMMWEQEVDVEVWQSDVQFGWRSIGDGYQKPTLDNLPPHSIIHFGASGNVQLYTELMEQAWDLVKG